MLLLLSMYRHQGNAGTLSHVTFCQLPKTVISFYIQSCSRTKSCRRQTAFIPILWTLSYKDCMTLFLFISNTLIPCYGIQVMIGRALAHCGSSWICLLLFYLLLVSLRLQEARRMPQDTTYVGHMSASRSSIKDLSFPLLLPFFRRKHNSEDTTHFTHTFTFLPTSS